MWVVGEASDMSSSRGGAQFREERERRGRERKRESQSIELLDAGFHAVLYVFRTSNSSSRWNLFLLQFILGQPKSKISNRSFYPIDSLDKLAKLKDRRRYINSCEKSLKNISYISYCK